MTAAKGATPASAPASQATPALNSTEAVRTKDGTDFEPVVSGINARGLEPAVLAELAMLPASSWSMVDEEKAASGQQPRLLLSLLYHSKTLTASNCLYRRAMRENLTTK